MSIFPQGLRHGEKGREGESQGESRALRLRGSKPGSSSRVEKCNDLAADRREGAMQGGGRSCSFRSMGLLEKGDRSGEISESILPSLNTVTGL